jgi:hypothetical protein
MRVGRAERAGEAERAMRDWEG